MGDLHHSPPLRLQRRPSCTIPSRIASNPTSSLLQDMLRDKKSQTQKAQKTYDAKPCHSNGQRHELDPRDIQSSPLAAMGTRDRPGMNARRTSGLNARGAPNPKDMGMREMQEYLSKVDKQAFDLKLKVFHAGQRNDELEAKVEKLEKVKSDNEKLHSINEGLRSELEERDLAIQEAVILICELEAKIEEMETASQGPKRPLMRSDSDFTSNHKSTFGSLPQTNVTEVPPIGPSTPSQDRYKGSDGSRSPIRGRLEPPRAPLNPRSLQRMPSFLKDDKKSTGALRSLYGSGNASFVTLTRPASVFSGDDDDDDIDRQILNSPRLSMLSESGFSEIYRHVRDQNHTPSPRNDSNANGHSPFKSDSSTSQQVAQREARVNKWVEERSSTPAQPLPKVGANDRFSSIGEVMEKLPSPSNERRIRPASPGLQDSGESHRYEGHDEQTYREKWSPRQSPQKQRGHRASVQPPQIFGSGQLPPTPDTMSTNAGANSSTQSIITEKSLADGAPMPINRYSAPLSDPCPQSSQGQFTRTLNTALVFDDDTGLEKSDDEQESTQVESSDINAGSDNRGLPQASPFMGGSIKAAEFSGATAPVRPRLSTHATDLMFNGESMSPRDHYRTISYPAPTTAAARASVQVSPGSQRNPGMVREKTTIPSPRDQTSALNAITTPPKTSPRHGQSRPPSIPWISRDEEIPSDSDMSLPRSSSLRFQVPKPHQNIASRLFRRSNSQTINNLPFTNNQDSSLPRPPFSRSASSTQQQQPNKPARPSSVYGQKPYPISYPKSRLRSMLPDGMLTDLERTAARPGTSDGYNDSTSRERQGGKERRHSAVLDTGANHVPAQGGDPHSHDRRRPERANARVWTIGSGHQRRESESQQTVRVDEGRSGRWGLGRTASARIREGFGFKR